MPMTAHAKGTEYQQPSKYVILRNFAVFIRNYYQKTKHHDFQTCLDSDSGIRHIR